MAKKKAKKKRKKTAKRKARRAPNPTSLAKSILSKVVEPGAKFSMTALKAGLRSAGHRNVGGWFDDMVKDAKRLRLISAVSKSIYVYTPAAANPCGVRRKKRKK